MSRWKQPQSKSEETVPLHRGANNFNECVLATVRTIQRGQTMTYKEVAILVGNPQAYRAVGNILHKNYDKSVPCHRVILSNGKTGGYNRGRINKIRRLVEEGVIF
ncbi:MAG TPA: 6-O-methylguanine DNA methyltransferase [Candidatus Andersenbacteria bacterium]|nr:MAG: cysteine methyltransferase [Parcubacteria group bacterium GW2011_GWA2_45_14]HBE90874.1 6-O-methylguanine DNA methyltransferase [Candidatus Andersenbacteria bacterium]